MLKNIKYKSKSSAVNKLMQLFNSCRKLNWDTIQEKKMHIFTYFFNNQSWVIVLLKHF